MPDPILVNLNPQWVNPDTRDSCKYSPVEVGKRQAPGVIDAMKLVLANRIDICKRLGKLNAPAEDPGWFSFQRAGPMHEPHLRSTNVPVIVISGGNAVKLAEDLNRSYILAWHPMNLRNEPLYLIVHKRDFNNYALAMAGLMARYRNMHLIGWSGAGMAGFGAARAAALAFADTLPYRPQRILMMDQDVVQTEATRHTKPNLISAVENKHQSTGKNVVALGVGYPTRSVPLSYSADYQTPKPAIPFNAASHPNDFNSPAQQFVSIQAPFRKVANKRFDDGIYPAYMVGGGEDMLMGWQQRLFEGEENRALLEARIVKKKLEGNADPSNEYWNVARVETLKAIYIAEKETLLMFEGAPITLEALMAEIVRRRLVAAVDTADFWSVSACIVERIILRLHKEMPFPATQEMSVFSQ